MELELSLDLVTRVREILAPHIRRTPILPSEGLSRLAGGEVFLKCENLQLTGSFKLRGALAAVGVLAPDRRARGVLTCSAGNHGAGLARAGTIFGAPVTVVLPRSTPGVKEARIRAEGAQVLRSPHDGYDATFAWMRAQGDALEGTYIPPCDAPEVVAGNGGTLLLEILESVPDPDWILMPCGGGGLSGGAGFAARALGLETRLIGVNSEASPGMWLSWRDGRAHDRLESATTLAEGLEGGVSDGAYRLSRRVLDELWKVPEPGIRNAMAWLAREERLVVEGSGAVGVAALLDGMDLPGRGIVILTGGNVDSGRLAGILGG